MPRLVVLLSGPVSAGKTTLATKLVDQFGFCLVKTWELLKARSPATQLERAALQRIGEELDQQTGGAWVAGDLVKFARERPDHPCMIVDAVRMSGQIDAVREAFGPRVVHIHLCAPLDVLERRYKRRKRGDIQELTSYSEVRSNKTESGVPELANIADVVIDSNRCTEDDVLVRAASALRLYGRGCDRLVDVVIGGGYGSEGKGQVTAYLSRKYDILVRVGGPNAGHKVYEEPEPYTFHSLPSGTRVCGANLVIGPGAVLYVPRLLKEIADSEVVLFQRTWHKTRVGLSNSLLGGQWQRWLPKL